MDDEFIKRYHDAPRSEFSEKLYERIDHSMTNQNQATTAHPVRRSLFRWSPALAVASLALIAVLLFSFAPARALAQDFLNLFRVKKFAAITVDPSRVQQLDDKVDWEALLSENMHINKDPGKPQLVASPEEASQRVGFEVKVPTVLPRGDVKLETYVQGEGSATFTANTEKAQSVLELLGITDVEIPASLNGAQVTVNKPPVAILKYTSGRQQLTLMQSPSPEVDLPPGANLAQLGEIGLRVIGLSKQEAHAFAQKVDWNSTFLIPVPANAAMVREVDVNGANGLLITSKTNARSNGPFAQGDSVLLWQRGGMVYGLEGNEGSVDLVEVASSLK